MAIIQAIVASFNGEILRGIHHFDLVAGDTFRIALYTDQADLGPQTTAYTSAGEVSASGYTAGGSALTNLGVTVSGTVGFASFSAVSWVSSGIAAQGAMIYNDTAVGNPAVCVLSFGFTRYSQAGVFTVTFPNNDSQNAIIRINAPLA